MKTVKKILREVGLILFLAAASASVLVIVSAPFWWYAPPILVSRILLCGLLAFIAIYTAASLHSEFRLVVRVERRTK